MPARDADDYEAKRQQIIDGALQVFSTKGFEKATNRDIAQAAGIGSPGLIYHYFRNKADLLQEVLLERSPVLQLIEHPDDLMKLPPRQALTLFGSRFMQTFEDRQAVSTFQLMLGEAARRPGVAKMFADVGPVRGLVVLTRYLEKEMDAGSLRRVDAGAAARTFVGPFVLYALTKVLFVLPERLQVPPGVVVETAVEIFLKGMEPGSQEFDQPGPALEKQAQGATRG